jgi:hypothetical protein
MMSPPAPAGSPKIKTGKLAAVFINTMSREDDFEGNHQPGARRACIRPRGCPKSASFIGHLAKAAEEDRDGLI